MKNLIMVVAVAGGVSLFGSEQANAQVCYGGGYGYSSNFHGGFNSGYYSVPSYPSYGYVNPYYNNFNRRSIYFNYNRHNRFRTYPRFGVGYNRWGRRGGVGIRIGW